MVVVLPFHQSFLYTTCRLLLVFLSMFGHCIFGSFSTFSFWLWIDKPWHIHWPNIVSDTSVHILRVQVVWKKNKGFSYLLWMWNVWQVVYTRNVSIIYGNYLCIVPFGKYFYKDSLRGKLSLFDWLSNHHQHCNYYLKIRRGKKTKE